MKNTINYIKQNWIILLQNSVIIFAAFGIAVSPFIVDYNTLPKGYELPKVVFYQIVCSIIILLTFILGIVRSKQSESFKLPKSFYLVGIITFLFILSALLSPYREIAIWGNSFRFQGLITYLLMLWAAYGVYININKSSWHVISLSFIFSTLVQCGLAFSQFTQLVKINPDSLLEGIWINGSFGQSNWFAGRLLIAIIFAAFYFGLRLGRNITLRIIFKLYFGLMIFCFLVILGLTQSGWGIASACFAIALILLYELLPKKVFIVFVTIVIAVSIILAAVFLQTNTEYNLRIEILNSIVTIITQPLSLNQLKILSLGFGFDTLGEVFKNYGLIKGLLVDRGHNFILDIIIQNGFIVLGIFIGLVLKIFIGIYKTNKNRILDFTFIAIIVWMFRSVIHENGIVNLMDFMFLIAIVLAFLFGKSHRLNSLNTKEA